MVILMFGPVPSNVPVPFGPVYQFIVAPVPAMPPLADSVTVSFGQ